MAFSRRSSCHLCLFLLVTVRVALHINQPVIIFVPGSNRYRWRFNYGGTCPRFKLVAITIILGTRTRPATIRLRLYSY